MILLVGLPEDPILKYFSGYLRRRQVSMIYVNQRRLGVDVTLDESSLQLANGWHIPFSEVSGVFNRANARLDGADFSPQQRAANILLHGLLDTQLPRVINAPKHMLSNCSKVYQLQQLRGTALQVPESWVLANSAVPPPWQSRVIYKSISSIRSIVQPIDQALLTKTVLEPVLFQPKLQGQNIRVHVVGEQLFACQITSDTLDYRYAPTPNQIHPYALPLEIAESCRYLTARLQLRFAGIDLIRTGSRRYFILEINPSPGYRYYESAWPEHPISKALVRHLLGINLTMSVLLLESTPQSLTGFANTLENRGIAVTCLSGQDLVRRIQIEDGWQGGQTWAMWHTKQGVIDLSELQGVYCPDIAALDLSCAHIAAKDRDFVQQSWYAYLWFRLASLPGCINPVQHWQLSLTQRQFPHQMQQAQVCGLKVPDYALSTDATALSRWQQGRRVISHQCLLKAWNFKASQQLVDQAIAAIVCPVGQWVVVHVIGSWVFASQHDVAQGLQHHAGLPSAVQLSCRRLVQRMGYKIAQILLRKTQGNQYWFYQLTPNVDWRLCAITPEYCWSALMQLLLQPGKQAPCPNRITSPVYLGAKAMRVSKAKNQRSFIPESLRPTLPGE